jgi:hypothetical protein
MRRFLRGVLISVPISTIVSAIATWRSWRRRGQVLPDAEDLAMPVAPDGDEREAAEMDELDRALAPA